MLPAQLQARVHYLPDMEDRNHGMNVRSPVSAFLDEFAAAAAASADGHCLQEPLLGGHATSKPQTTAISAA